MIEYYEFENLVGKQLPPLHDFFCTQNPYPKLFLGRTFLIVNRFSKFLQHILGQTKRQI